jgi:hypothetical protein
MRSAARSFPVLASDYLRSSRLAIEVLGKDIIIAPAVARTDDVSYIT